MKKFKPYPDWICSDCGMKYGKPRTDVSTFHMAKCDVCGNKKSVTQPRDYGYPTIPGFKRED
jgi:hypothetical protein